MDPQPPHRHRRAEAVHVENAVARHRAPRPHRQPHLANADQIAHRAVDDEALHAQPLMRPRHAVADAGPPPRVGVRILVHRDQRSLLAADVVVEVHPIERGRVLVVGRNLRRHRETGDQPHVRHEAADRVVGVVKVGQPQLQGHRIENCGGVVLLQRSDLLGQHRGSPGSVIGPWDFASEMIKRFGANGNSES